MKFVKPGMFVSVVKDMPTPRFLHSKVTTVTDQDTITVVYGGATLIATRLAGSPNWRVNRFGAGT